MLPRGGEHEKNKSAFLRLYICPIGLKFTGFTLFCRADIISEIQSETPDGVEWVRVVRFLVTTEIRPSKNVEFYLGPFLEFVTFGRQPRHLYHWKELAWHIKMVFVSLQ